MEIIMKKIHNQLLGTGILVALLMAGTAATASYLTKGEVKPQVQTKASPNMQPQKLASSALVQSQCNDSNILGYIAGGAAGGLAGNQIGKGAGNTAATIGGVLGGAYLGGQYIPLKNVTCRQ
jgi:outer membrane lipoprotein SlyB